MTEAEMDPEERRERLRYSLGKHKGRAERLSGLGLFEHTMDDPKIEAARVSGWREADANPDGFALDDEVHAFQHFLEEAKKEFA